MKRVVLVRSNPVAPDPPVEKMADTLISNGYDVKIIAWDRFNDYYVKEEEISLSKKVRVIRFGIKAAFGAGINSLKQLIQFEIRLFRWLITHRKDYDIIHAFDFDTGFVSRVIAKLYKKKLVYHILDFYIDSHGLARGKLGGIVKKMEYGVINSADATIICTEKRREQISGSKAKYLEIIHNTPQQSVQAATDFLIDGDSMKCKIAYVGILAGGRLLKETAELVAHDERFEMHIGGFGSLETEIQQLASRCPNIFFYGRLSYDKTLALETQCDIMTAIYDPSVPNHKFAAPNKFYESLMLGKPVIMVKNTGFDDIISKNGNGCLTEYSTDGIKASMDYLYNHRQDFSIMGERAKNLYNTKFSWDIMRDRIVKIYELLQ